MPFELRLLVVSLAAFAWAGIAGTVVAAWLWRRPLTGAAVDRAARLLRIRLIPAAAALSASGLAIISFARFENRGAEETTGWILIGLAALSGALFAGALVRALLITLRTRQIWREWMRAAEPVVLADIAVPAFAVSSHFPVVAVVGLWRPRLVIARSVLACCSDDEVRAILRHERHHLARRDNLRRAVLALAPDIWALLPASARLLRAWHEATEEAADDFSRRASASGGVMLAQALLKVARLTPSGHFAPALPASALYRGENLERRVRRLLVPDLTPPGRRTAGWMASGAIVALAVCILGLEEIHHLVELAVTLLP